MIAAFTRLLRQQRPPARGTTPRALIVAPTRELAIQIREEAELLGRHCGFRIHAVYGGIDYEKQAAVFTEQVDILIGTPGRLIDYFRQKLFSVRHTEILVIDEADRMFDMGFIDDIRYLIRHMSKPSERTSYVYSATLPYKVLELAYEHMHDPERVVIEPEQKTAANIDEQLYHVGMREKFATLLCLLEREKPESALIFVNTRSMASELARKLNLMGYQAMGLAGDVDQKKRLKVIRGFKDHEINMVVATDVASRGLHVDHVTHVFNYDLPQDAEDYVHRVGRTARAGASGKAVSLACEHFVYSLEAIEAYIGHKLPATVPQAEFEEELADMRKRWREVRSNAPPPPRRGSQGLARSGDQRRRSDRRSAERGRRRDEKQHATTRVPRAASTTEDRKEPDEPAKSRRRRRRRRPDAKKPKRPS